MKRKKVAAMLACGVVVVVVVVVGGAVSRPCLALVASCRAPHMSSSKAPGQVAAWLPGCLPGCLAAIASVILPIVNPEIGAVSLSPNKKTAASSSSTKDWTLDLVVKTDTR